MSMLRPSIEFVICLVLTSLFRPKPRALALRARAALAILRISMNLASK